MKKTLCRLFLALAVCAPCPAKAEWVDISKSLPETDIQAVTVDAKNPRTLYAASQRRVYRSADTGEHWKQVLGLRGGTDNAIHFILSDPGGSRIFAASEKGIQISRDAGKSWKYFYRGMGDRAKAVYGLCADGQDPAVLWAGTANGLVKITGDGQEAKAVEGIPSVKVFSVMTARDGEAEKIWAATEKGIYMSVDSGTHWERVFVEVGRTQENTEETSLSQFQIEEIATAPVMSNLVRVPGREALLAASSKGIWEGVKNGKDWAEFKNANLPDHKINYLAVSGETFYAATDRGVFQWQEENKTFKDLSDGLGSKEVRMLAYGESSGDLFAATSKGVFRYPKPDFKVPPIAVGVVSSAAQPKLDAEEILRRFETEPSIGEIQNAAIRYAEVHPDKIEAWREAAARKAFMPTLSLTTDSTQDHNVDIDRGGTGDPDKFIIGPQESQTDWHMGLSWDLGELIWNNDQTSIDTRSRLLVELRDDVLNEVTHLYYERRRLQVEMFLAPAKELPLEIERQLKLDELTAGVDALTGGYLSRRLAETPHA